MRGHYTPTISNMEKFVVGIVTGIVLTVIIGLATGALGNTPATVKTAKPLVPTGVYIKVNPGGVNDTTYIYEVKPN